MNPLTTHGPLQILGTEWFFELPHDIDPRPILNEVYEILITFDQTYSRFRSDSQISVLNKAGYLNSPSEEMCELLHQGVSLYARSKEYFNFLTGHIQVARGYDENLSFTEASHSPPSSYPNPTTDIKITKEKIILTQGAVDLGGFGKGFVIDKIVDHLKERWGLSLFVINGGGDIYVHNTTPEALTFYIEHPFKLNTYTHLLPDLRGALAVSSSQKRVWKTTNTKQEYSHLISADVHIPGSAVLADSATMADAYATIYSLAHQKINELPDPKPPYLLVYKEGRTRQHTHFGGTEIN